MKKTWRYHTECKSPPMGTCHLDSADLSYGFTVTCYSESTNVILMERAPTRSVGRRLKDLPIVPALPSRVESAHAVQTLLADPSVAVAPSG